jgi:protein-tyrosine phosphatase
LLKNPGKVREIRRSRLSNLEESASSWAITRLLGYGNAMDRVLFICTGNYYRSRFAEILFNRLVEEKGLRCRAISRGLAIELCATLPGVISPFTIEALQSRKLTCASIHRNPTQLSQVDLENADLIIALKEAEHRPLLRSRYPGWEDRVTYWHVHDLDGSTPEVAMGEIERLVRELVERA